MSTKAAAPPTTDTEEKSTFLDNVVVVKVTVLCPPTTKKDDFLTDELCKKLKAQTSSVKVRKDLFKIREVTKYRDEARRVLRERCVPWTSMREDANGVRKPEALWAIAGHEIKDLARELQELKEQFIAAAKERADNYEDVLEDAEKRLGGAFNKDEFPSAEDFFERFVWENEFHPVRSEDDVENDFRNRLPEAVAEEQIAKHKRDTARRIHNATQSVLDTLARKHIEGTENDPGLVDRLERYDPDPNDKRVGNTYRDTRLYDNIDDFTEWAKSIHSAIPSDELGALIDKLDDFRTRVRPADPTEVRENDEVRKRVIEGLRALIGNGIMPDTEDEGTGNVTKGPGGGFTQF